MEKKGGNVLTIVLVAVIVFLGTYILSGGMSKDDPVVQQQTLQSVVPSLTQPQQFVDQDSLLWTVQDTIYAEFDGYSFFKALQAVNEGGESRVFNANDLGLVLLVALANSNDKGIRKVLEAYNVRVIDFSGKVLFEAR